MGRTLQKHSAGKYVFFPFENMILVRHFSSHDSTSSINDMLLHHLTT